MVLSQSLLFFWNKNVCFFLVTLLLHNVIPEKVYLNKVAVHVRGGLQAANRVARDAGLRNIGQIGSLEDHYLFEIPNRQKRSSERSHEHHAALSTHPEVHWFEQQVAKVRTKRDLVKPLSGPFKLNDPYYDRQWYLHGGGHGGFDMNVISAWKKGFTGRDIVVTILDDGIERDHPDLIKNYDPYASYDVNDQDNDPMPRYDNTNENRHGTRCAGEVSAVANNSNCAVGIAYNSKIGGVRMLDGEVFDAVEAASLSFNRSHIHIYSASWGPDDDGRVVDGPGPLAKKAFENGIRFGRDGKGSIFVWASGNGGSAQDSCNCDGYANSIYTLSISSTSEHGTKPWYLEECSSTLATTYSSGAFNEKQIVTVDLHQRCTETHTGTSASAPLAAGIVALILEANPDLTWRDVQYITLMTARPEPMVDGQWVTNALGRQVSLRYGYGLMDASRMVDLALQWRTVPEKRICVAPSQQGQDDMHGARHVATVSTDGCAGSSDEVRYLEHVQCRIEMSYGRRGDIVIHLTSPQGTRSTLLPRRPNDLSSDGFRGWPFLSVHFWGENPQGQWMLEIENGNPYSGELDSGQLLSWELVLHGTGEQPVRLKNETSTTTTTTAPTKIANTVPGAFTKDVTGDTTHVLRPTILKTLCHEECVADCIGLGPENCLQCKNFINQTNGVCVPSCSDGTYADNTTCKPCDLSCRTCSGPTLAQCLSCYPGITLHAKFNTCYTECVGGTYSEPSGCLPCHGSCKTCFGPEINHCLSCQKEKQLFNSRCITKHSWWSGTQKSVQGIILALISVCALLLLIIGAVLTVYLYQHRKLCWTYKYDKLPCHDGEDEESAVSLTYSIGDEERKVSISYPNSSKDSLAT
ncbi:furin-like protease kpc-1 [Pomacea canaliculata]|uniref:furin-like protease kpc-1 n=1 Tax=Pomacea canaliculata TaxID=400727 RepID=UPI000D734368|nr:furin-like protease kpc-1 [Pomacea canaliculata]